MKEKEPATSLCPFCGADQRELIPLNTVQMKCPYCAGTILVPAAQNRRILWTGK